MSDHLTPEAAAAEICGILSTHADVADSGRARVQLYWRGVSNSGVSREESLATDAGRVDFRLICRTLRSATWITQAVVHRPKHEIDDHFVMGLEHFLYSGTRFCNNVEGP